MGLGGVIGPMLVSFYGYKMALMASSVLCVCTLVLMLLEYLVPYVKVNFFFNIPYVKVNSLTSTIKYHHLNFCFCNMLYFVGFLSLGLFDEPRLQPNRQRESSTPLAVPTFPVSLVTWHLPFRGN
jgi:hypothetical protein